MNFGKFRDSSPSSSSFKTRRTVSSGHGRYDILPLKIREQADVEYYEGDASVETDKFHLRYDSIHTKEEEVQRRNNENNRRKKSTSMQHIERFFTIGDDRDASTLSSGGTRSKKKRSGVSAKQKHRKETPLEVSSSYSTTSTKVTIPTSNLMLSSSTSTSSLSATLSKLKKIDIQKEVKEIIEKSNLSIHSPLQIRAEAALNCINSILQPEFASSSTSNNKKTAIEKRKGGGGGGVGKTSSRSFLEVFEEARKEMDAYLSSHNIYESKVAVARSTMAAMLVLRYNNTNAINHYYDWNKIIEECVLASIAAGADNFNKNNKRKSSIDDEKPKWLGVPIFSTILSNKSSTSQPQLSKSLKRVLAAIKAAMIVLLSSSSISSKEILVNKSYDDYVLSTSHDKNTHYNKKCVSLKECSSGKEIINSSETNKENNHQTKYQPSEGNASKGLQIASEFGRRRISGSNQVEKHNRNLRSPSSSSSSTSSQRKKKGLGKKTVHSKTKNSDNKKKVDNKSIHSAASTNSTATTILTTTTTKQKMVKPVVTQVSENCLCKITAEDEFELILLNEPLKK